MRKVLFYSLLLILGLLLNGLQPPNELLREVVRLATTFCLAFIMIHVGYEFEMDKSRPRVYLKDTLIAFSAAGLPWVFCALYFVLVLAPRAAWDDPGVWKASLMQAAFASPTSAGVLFSMLAAAGLGATWLFKKARLLAIFDDLGTILLLIPLKIMVIGELKWQLGVVVVVLVGLLWAGYRYLNTLSLPHRWPWVVTYAALLVFGTEALHHVDALLHIEVLLPAFVLGCLMKPPPGTDPHADDAMEGVEEGPEHPGEQRVSTLVSACFMVLVGMSMPPVDTGGAGFPGWGVIALHVLAVTVLSNLGKMVPALCYREEAKPNERLALAVGMFPRGEVGAGVLVISLSYGFGGTALTVAVFSLALNLLLTGAFIWVVKRLLARPPAGDAARHAARG